MSAWARTPATTARSPVGMAPSYGVSDLPGETIPFCAAPSFVVIRTPPAGSLAGIVPQFAVGGVL
jgi:hypothetical protein